MPLLRMAALMQSVRSEPTPGSIRHAGSKKMAGGYQPPSLLILQGMDRRYVARLVPPAGPLDPMGWLAPTFGPSEAQPGTFLAFGRQDGNQPASIGNAW